MRASLRGRTSVPAEAAEAADSRRRSRVSMDQPAPKPIPTLRVVRHVATVEDAVRAGTGFATTEDLGLFVDGAARQNRTHGYGYSVGSMALTLVSERHVQLMIKESRPGIKRRDEIELRRRLGRSVKRHILGRQSDKAFARIQEAPAAVAAQAPGYVDDGRSVYRPGFDVWTDVDDVLAVDVADVDAALGWEEPDGYNGSHDTVLSAEDRFALDVHGYGHQVLTASGVRFMGGKRWALTFDRSTSADIRGERRELLGVFAANGLNTRGVQRDLYDPHVTFFHLHGHVPDSTPLTLSADVPWPQVWMLPPTLEQ